MQKRTAFSLLELLVVMSIIGVCFALVTAAVQRVREAASRLACKDNLRQIGLALHHFHDSNSTLPVGMTFVPSKTAFLYLAWPARILPFLERMDLWNQIEPAFAIQPDFRRLPHPGNAALSVFMCRSDPRFGVPGQNGPWAVGLLSYLGNEGVDQVVAGGVLYVNSAISFNAITDGLSNTLMIGERPPSQDSHLGWWYGGSGQNNEGSGDSVLGARELFDSRYHVGCDKGPYHFVPGTLTEECDFLHFWSLHPGGANFAFCDGSVRFLAYSADAVLPALATRAGGEAVSVPE